MGKKKWAQRRGGAKTETFLGVPVSGLRGGGGGQRSSGGACALPPSRSRALVFAFGRLLTLRGGRGDGGTAGGGVEGPDAGLEDELRQLGVCVCV